MSPSAEALPEDKPDRAGEAGQRSDDQEVSRQHGHRRARSEDRGKVAKYRDTQQRYGQRQPDPAPPPRGEIGRGHQPQQQQNSWKPTPEAHDSHCPTGSIARMKGEGKDEG